MKSPLFDFHVHTSFCDGKCTPEELVREALEKGLQRLGFSGHSFTPFDPGYCMSEEGAEAYRAEIGRLKEIYGDRIRLYCGVEQDLDSELPRKPYDYMIGSVHYLRQGDAYLPVDLSAERILQDTRQYFGGDVYRYVREYYRRVAEVVRRTGCGIVGHFDLVEKFNENGALFDNSDPRCRLPMLEALDAVLETDAVIEINTGAMARGLRRCPYPSAFLLRRIAEKRGRVMMNSDCHRPNGLAYAFEEATQLAVSCGIGAFTAVCDGGFETISLRR